MRPQVLVVEDDESFITEVMGSIAANSLSVDVSVARCRERACQFLNERFFDFAILDLNIPTQEDGLDADPGHGKYVFHYARKVSPGTKLLVLTGSPSDDFIADMLAQKHEADIWSEGTRVGTVEFLRKIDLMNVDGIIDKALSAIHSLGDVELEMSGVNLETGQDRLVRIFAKKFDAARCIISPIGAGRSGAVPFRLQLFDQSGMPVQVAVAKLATLAKIADENTRFDNHVVLLDPASTPRKMVMLEFGGGSTAGLFYQLAAGYEQSLFAVMANDDTRAARAVEAASSALSAWAQGKAQIPHNIASIRLCWLDDAIAVRLSKDYNLDWVPAFESIKVQTRWCFVHGDLHGENVLVSLEDKSVVIDYGDVRRGIASYDPVTLELSAVLQQNPTLSDSWPTIEQCKNWNKLEHYLVGSPIPMYVRACRTWAERCAAGRREVAASAYSYLLRQLKYEDTNKARILALFDGVRSYMKET